MENINKNENLQRITEIETDTIELLLKANFVFEHAKSHCNLNSEYDAMIAIHGFDNAIEYLIRIIVKHLKIDESKNANWDNMDLAGLAGEVNKYLNENSFGFTLPNTTEIKLLRKLRNLVQHDMVAPQTDLGRLANKAEDFFNRSILLVFKMDRKNLNLSSLIKNELIRSFLSKSEENIIKEKYLESIISSRDAFENAKFEITKSSMLRFSSIPALIEKKEDFNLHRFMSDITSEIEAIKLGLNAEEYSRFLEYTDFIPADFCAKRYGYSILPRDWEKNDADFCYHFCANAILRWQESKRQPIAVWTSIEEYFWEKFIDGRKVDKIIESAGIIYVDGDESRKEFFYVKEDTKELLELLVKGEIYDFMERRYIDGKIDYESLSKIEIKNIDFMVLVNNPKIWAVTLWFKDIPFSVRRKELDAKGNLVSKTVILNNASAKDISGIFEDVFSLDFAEKVISLRNDLGKISGEKDLKKIDNITAHQISVLKQLCVLE